MPLHPRLQPPTLESPLTRSHSFTVALALTVLAAGFAYAMPRTVLTNAEEDPQQAELVLSPTGSTDTPTATIPTSRPEKTTKDKDETGQDGDDGGTERTENHGAAVSTAAHCDLDGKAHGEFVRSIAHDKDATVAEVEAACAAAQAAAHSASQAADDSDDATRGRDHAKLPKAKLDGDAADDDGDDDSDDESDDSEDDASAESAADDDDASNGGPPEHAKATKDKP